MLDEAQLRSLEDFFRFRRQLEHIHLDENGASIMTGSESVAYDDFDKVSEEYDSVMYI